MAVLNIHERLLPAPPERLAPLIDGLAAPDDALWPGDRWPALRLDGPLAVGARGGHGPIRYTVDGYAPGRWIRFRFGASTRFDGFHEFSVHPRGEDTVIRHTLAGRPRGRMRAGWPLAIRWLHDALLEDALDHAERYVTGTVDEPARWSAYVRLLRRPARGGSRLRAAAAQRSAG
jgi:hypothetical protein